MLKFLGVGAQKAGTTWLYNALKNHRLICFPQGKELHFWNNDIDEEKINKYLNVFHHPTLTEGEITPAYGHIGKCKIEAIYHYLPDIKIIYIMRNPMERAWSSALMALKRSEMNFDEASNQWFIDHFYSAGSLARGDYKKSLQNWYGVYPPENILLLVFEDMIMKPEETIKVIFEHLDINTPSTQEIKSWRLENKIFVGSGYRIRPEFRYILNSIYREKIIALENYLKINLSCKWRTM